MKNSRPGRERSEGSRSWMGNLPNPKVTRRMRTFLLSPAAQPSNPGTFLSVLTAVKASTVRSDVPFVRPRRSFRAQTITRIREDLPRDRICPHRKDFAGNQTGCVRLASIRENCPGERIPSVHVTEFVTSKDFSFLSSWKFSFPSK